MQPEIPTGSVDQDERLLLHALADAEVDAATALRLERRMGEDPALAAEYARIVALKGVVGRLRAEAVPDDFAARIAGLARRDTGATPPPAEATARSGSPAWLSMAAAMVVAAGLASGLTYTTMTARMSAGALETAIVSGHRRALLAATPIDVASSDRHTVRPWFDAKLGVAPPTPDLAADGFTLVGGRVEVIADRPVPVLVYRHNEHLITVVALPLPTPAPAEPPVAGTDAGYNVVRWTGDSFQYWAVSDLEANELARFVQAMRRR